mmetsp:Transcript_40630/g.91244  ORF Transcript_40630/g.91244 Transcript_40630/m.91244 type:complete len:465 (-) Transcript_40630:8-1402(-)
MAWREVGRRIVPRLHFAKLQLRQSATVTPWTREECEATLASKAQVPTIYDAPKVMRPGNMVDVATVTKNWWCFPPVGFNSILEIPVEKFEVLGGEDAKQVGVIVVPNSIFGVPIRKDLIFRVYWYHRKALAGYQDTMQLYKWEWPGSNKKYRSQKKSGKGRMGRRKAPHHYEGVFVHPLRPRDWRIMENKRVIWRALKCMLSVKYAQGALTVVDSFNLQSHKTKHLVQYLRRILGRRCKSAMLVHEGVHDVNDNFRWASAHISQVCRENVEGVNVYNLLKYHELVITEPALTKLIQAIQEHPYKNGWCQKFATPDAKPAPIPSKVPDWNKDWIARKVRLQNSDFRGKEFFHERQKWQWSYEVNGPLRIPKTDPLAGFRLKDFVLSPERPVWEKLESLYVDDAPIDEEMDDQEYHDLVETFETTTLAGEAATKDVFDDRAEIELTRLQDLAKGRKSTRTRADGKR